MSLRLGLHRHLEHTQVGVAHDVEYIMVQVRDHGERLGNDVGKAAIPVADLLSGASSCGVGAAALLPRAVGDRDLEGWAGIVVDCHTIAFARDGVA